MDRDPIGSSVESRQARRCLSGSVLFWRGVSRRAEENGILRLPFFKETRNAKVDQVDVPIPLYHHIGGLQIAEDDRRLMLMQVVQNITELQRVVNDLRNWQGLMRIVQ